MLQAQLNSEKRTLQELKQVYQQALKDCEKKIRELSARTDMENLQTIIYQKRYQEALKGQLEGVMATLQSNSYATVSDYLARCYQDGYIGVMYDIHGQGVPIIMPMDQKAIVKAIQTDSKISKGLYSRLGEDVQSLKTSIRAELSRGISNGSSWNEVAGKLGKSFKSTAFSKAYNNSMRIVRTEGHRVQVQSARDAQQAAKGKGADVLKQWDATLDGDTRPTHRQLDGQSRELDEPFEADGKQADAPGMFGDPAEDCNCRCAVLQRARWALDEAELDMLQDRAAFFLLDKSENFEDFKSKYLQLPDNADTMDINTDVRSQLQLIKDRLSGNRASLDDLKEAGQIVKCHIGEYQATDAEKEYSDAYSQVLDMSKLIRQGKMSSSSDEYIKAYIRWKDAEKNVQGLEEKRARWLSNALSDIREMGTSGIESDVSAHLNNSRSATRKYVENAYSIYPREWVEKSIIKGKLTPKKAKRGYYSEWDEEIAISGEGGKAFKTSIHELGHRFERAVPEIREAEKEFYEHRTEGEPLKWLGSGYRRNEKTRFDDFVSPYMGKDYGGSSYELVSMGFEYAYTRPEELAKDPEMEAWILGILALY